MTKKLFVFATWLFKGITKIGGPCTFQRRLKNFADSIVLTRNIPSLAYAIPFFQGN